MIDYKYKVFKEIIIGNLSKEELLQSLSEADIKFNPYAEVLFSHNKFTPNSVAKKVRLVKITLSKLGLDETCTFDEFTSRLSSVGLKLCPLYLAAF